MKLLIITPFKVVNIYDRSMVMPFTAEEFQLVHSIAHIEQEATAHIPVSRRFLVEAVKAGQFGTPVPYDICLEGYMMCMKRVIREREIQKFVTFVNILARMYACLLQVHVKPRLLYLHSRSGPEEPPPGQHGHAGQPQVCTGPAQGSPSARPGTTVGFFDAFILRNNETCDKLMNFFGMRYFTSYADPGLKMQEHLTAPGILVIWVLVTIVGRGSELHPFSQKKWVPPPLPFQKFSF
jgi:hypothetical protein